MKRSFEQVENSTSGLSRFGLKRADVLGHKAPEPTPRRTEITLGKPQEPGLRRADAPASKIPEMPQRRAEPNCHLLQGADMLCCWGLRFWYVCAV
uniref:Uncharacterized protein n=1 Tax=Pavo cristatus TaxID=9049 RepID=A0A8C9FLC0_PAVCR